MNPTARRWTKLTRAYVGVLLVRVALSVRVPSTLGFIACLVQLVPVANLVLAPLLWGMFMVRMDAAQAEAEAERLDVELVLKPIGWLKVAGIVVGAVIALWVMLAVVFFAIWRFVNPDAPMQ